MSPRTRAGGLAVLFSVLVLMGGAGPAVAVLSPAPAGPSLRDGSSTQAPTPQPHEHGHEDEQPSPTPSSEHEHEVEPEAPTDGHGDHGTTPPDSVSTTTRSLVIGGFGVLNAGVIAAAALVRRRQRRTPGTTRPGTRR